MFLQFAILIALSLALVRRHRRHDRADEWVRASRVVMLPCGPARGTLTRAMTILSASLLVVWAAVALALLVGRHEPLTALFYFLAGTLVVLLVVDAAGPSLEQVVSEGRVRLDGAGLKWALGAQAGELDFSRPIAARHRWARGALATDPHHFHVWELEQDGVRVSFYHVARHPAPGEPEALVGDGIFLHYHGRAFMDRVLEHCTVDE